MTETLSVIVLALAVWRISNMIADTDQSGPFNILDLIRSKAGVYYDEMSIPQAKKGSLGDMLICVYCNSVWIGIIFAILWFVNQKVTIIVSLPFALSALSILIEDWRTRWK